MRSKETELIASFSASLKRSERGVAVRVKAARARKAAESPGCWVLDGQPCPSLPSENCCWVRSAQLSQQSVLDAGRRTRARLLYPAIRTTR